jgi:hypothetical protein
MRKPLPIGAYTFRDIVEGGLLYIDKTRWIYDLVQHPKGLYFFSRPRRFGKSLLLSIFHEIFQGEKELFHGLWIYESDYQWPQHPVIHLDFSRERVYTAAELEEFISSYLEEIAEENGIELAPAPYQRRFHRLIRQLAKSGKKVVILIDEYDKPLLDNIENLPEAIAIRERLKAFYTVIKAMDAHIRFVFLTGVSKFSKVGVFSGLNNLNDITMHPGYAALLGLTEEELKSHLIDYIAAFAAEEGMTTDEMMARIRHWYNGFRFAAGDVNVYNPFSTLLLLEQKRFANFWFDTGTPSFLINLIRNKGYDIENVEMLNVPETVFSTYEIESLNVVPLLFQTGYLTIKDYDKTKQLYRLYYPNYEVENAFLNVLLKSFNNTQNELVEQHLWDLVEALKANKLDDFFATLAIFFAQVPYPIQLKDEKYYQTIFYLIFKLLGLKIDAEVVTNQGRIDAVVELTDHIYLFEFKLDGTAEEALAQIKTNRYYERYQSSAKQILLVGANFSTEKRRVDGWTSGKPTDDAIVPAR